MTTIKFNYFTNGALPLAPMNVECVPIVNDTLRISHDPYIVKKREFWIENGRIDSVELFLERAS